MSKLYKETNDAECLWLLSELYVHKSNSNKRDAMKYALNGLVQDYNNSGLHDNFVVCSNGIMVDFKKRNHNKIIEYYYYFIKVHPDSLISRRILIENLIDNYRLDEAMVEVKETYKIAGDKRYIIEFYEGEILFKRGYQEKAVEFWRKICERNEDKRNYYEALNTINLILSVYEKDYGLTDGEELKPYLHDMDRIQKLIDNKNNM